MPEESTAQPFQTNSLKNAFGLDVKKAQKYLTHSPEVELSYVSR
jgi:hypothetical protein